MLVNNWPNCLYCNESIVLIAYLLDFAHSVNVKLLTHKFLVATKAFMRGCVLLNYFIYLSYCKYKLAIVNCAPELTNSNQF